MTHIIYNIMPTVPFGSIVAFETALASIGAGIFIIVVLLSYMKKDYLTQERVGIRAAIFLYAATLILLILDLEHPLRFWHLLRWFNPASMLSWGTLIIILYGLCLLTYAYFHYKKKTTNIIGKIGVPLAILMSVYPGFLLAVLKSRPLWNTGLIPVLFLAMSVLGGTSLLYLLLVYEKMEKKIVPLFKMILRIAVLSVLLLVITQIVINIYSTVEARAATMLLLTGPMSFIYVGLGIVLGLIIPLILLFRKVSMIYPTAFAIVGVISLRYAIVIAGQLIPLS